MPPGQPSKPQKPEPPHGGTQVETDDDIRRALAEGAPPVVPVIPSEGWERTVAPPAPAPPANLPPAARVPAPPAPVPPKPVAPPAPAAAPKPAPDPRVPFAPTLRPPVAELTVFDDGRTDGEVVRIRGDRFVIGRAEGDLVIPHDDLISTRHVEVTRQRVEGGFRWVVTDLGSTNGLFVRVSRTILSDGTEILVGGGRYRFDAPDGTPDETAAHLPPASQSHATVGWAERSPLGRPPALTELVPGGIGNRVVLTRPEYWVGTDPGCDLCRPGDPFCEPRHARVYRGPKGGWLAEHNKTLNGLWYRVPQAAVETTLLFQIGEQRFRLRV